MSRKKFNTFPARFHWKDALGFSSLLFGLFLAALTLNGKNNAPLKKQETVVSMAEKQLQSIVIPQSISKEEGEHFMGPPTPLVGPPRPAELSKKTSPVQGLIKQVFNNKYSAY